MNELERLIDDYVDASNRLNLLRIKAQAAQDEWVELQAQEQAASARTIEAHERLRKYIEQQRMTGGA